MPHSFSSLQKPVLSAQQLYESLRALVETPQNIGKLILLDVSSGDYEINDSPDDLGLEALRRLQSRRPAATPHALRIGCRTAVSFGGPLERTEEA